MDATTYADHWERESRAYEEQDIYRALARITPAQRTLEIGCGIGLGTVHLARDRQVLSIDNNLRLIHLARHSIQNAGVDARVVHDDAFSVTELTASQVEAFGPEGIVCWFAGSHPDDVLRHTSSTVPPQERPGQYRENLEDLLLQPPLCGQSVEWIHFAYRVGVAIAASPEEIIEATTVDYNTYVLMDSPFRVANVEVFDWSPGELEYIFASNPAFMGGQVQRKVISLLARRI